MQRRASTQTRAANAAERRYLAWVKEQPCAACRCDPPAIAHHCWGATAKKKLDGVTVLIGMWAVIPLCANCDDLVTHGSRRALESTHRPQIHMLTDTLSGYPRLQELPDDVAVVFALMDAEQRERMTA